MAAAAAAAPGAGGSGGDGAALKPYASRRQLALLQSRPLYQQPLYAHWGVQIIVPLVLLGDIALFAAGNVSDGANVVVELKLAGERVQLPDIFSFQLANTVSDMWAAGCYFLAILVLGLSGVWTYLKLVMMLACWYAPPAYLPPHRREYALRALDALGKWSLLDFLMLVMMRVAFHLKIDVASTAAPSTAPSLRWPRRW